MFILNTGILSSSNYLGSGGSELLLEARNISTPTSITLNVPVTIDYDFYSSISSLEANSIITADELTITGTLTAGSTITANIINLYIPNGGTVGTHIYRWYRGTDLIGGGEVLISGASNNTYLLTEDEAGLRIRVEVDLKQSGVANTNGKTIKSLHTTTTVVSNDPVVLIGWDNAHRQSDLASYLDGVWLNRGANGSTYVKSGITPPTYNVTENALEFTRANSNAIGFIKSNPAMTDPVEIWFRIKPKSLAGLTYTFLSWTSSYYLSINTSNKLRMNGTASTINSVVNTWHVIRYRYDGVNSTITVNNGTPEVLSLGASSFGTTLGTIGSSYTGTNYFDGFISDLFIKNDLLDAGQTTTMLNEFEL